MKKILFIDRDGTIIREPADFQVDSIEKLEFVPDVISSLAAIARETDFELVMVTNQDGLGTDSLPEKDFFAVHDLIMRTLTGENIEFADVCIDRSFEHENAPTRKPRTGMLTRYLSNGYDLVNSYVIGDRITDVELARNLGCKAIFLRNENFDPPKNDDVVVKVADSWRIYMSTYVFHDGALRINALQMRPRSESNLIWTVPAKARSRRAFRFLTTCWISLPGMVRSI